MTTSATVWTELFRVRSYEADPGGTASIQSICNYLQEAASNHAADLGVSIEHLTEQNLIWMLARLRVEVDAFPEWRDEVVVETWPSGLDRLYATRDFLVRSSAKKPLGRATSAWLLVDAERRRPVRLPDLITQIARPERERVLEDLPDKLPDPPEPVSELPIRVRYSDQDLIGHVNNVLYLEWSVESVPEEMMKTHEVRSIELQFRAEANYGDAVTVRTGRVSASPSGDGVSDTSFLHLIAAGNRELARVRSTWRPR